MIIFIQYSSAKLDFFWELSSQASFIEETTVASPCCSRQCNSLTFSTKSLQIFPFHCCLTWLDPISGTMQRLWIRLRSSGPCSSCSSSSHQWLILTNWVWASPIFAMSYFPASYLHIATQHHCEANLWRPWTEEFPCSRLERRSHSSGSWPSRFAHYWRNACWQSLHSC